MNAYDNDPRVYPDPIVGDGYWLVEAGGWLYNVVEQDDGLFCAFVLDRHQPTGQRKLGKYIDRIPKDDFDTVVWHLIGPPR